MKPKNSISLPAADTIPDISFELLSQAKDGMVIIDDHNMILYANPAAETLWGYEPGTLVGRPVSELLAASIENGHLPFNMEAPTVVPEPVAGEVTFENRSGDYISAEVSLSAAKVGASGRNYRLMMVRGITGAGHRSRVMELQNTVFRSLSSEIQIQDVADMVCREVEVLVPNTVAVLILLDEQNRLRILSGPGMPRRFAAALEEMRLTEADIAALANDLGEATTIVWDSYRSVGISLGLHHCWASAIRTRNDRITGIFALYSRSERSRGEWPAQIVNSCVPFCGVLIEQHEARQHISQLSNFDPLTGFLNRTAVHKVIRSMIGQPGDNHFALYMIDIDRFRDINDALGHINGDGFLKSVSERLKGISRSNYVLSRSGPNEFLIIVPNTRKEDAVKFATMLHDSVKQPIEIGGNMIVPTLGIGISVFPENGPDGESLLSYAEQAMRHAKRAGLGMTHLARSEDNKAAQDRLLLGSALRESLAKGLLNLQYQPQIDVRNNTLYGVEALSRWNHPTLGNIYPSRFIAVAEETGQIEAIGTWSLERAVHQILEWDAHGVHVPTVAVNLSAGHFRNRNLPGFIARLLSESRLEPKRLTVEITESVMMTENEDTNMVLQAIRNLGVALSMDDFGTGYSSLSRLTRLPLTEIKIDRSFIMNLEHDANAQAVTTAVIGIGGRLGMTVVTEGVETIRQLDLLRQLGCDVVQGYLFARPMTPDKLEEWIRDNRLAAVLKEAQDASVAIPSGE
ncbi:c-di-GMP phosphodiesterase [Komagataeibacter rhaeticus]|uniref:EAL domain-containing protein n=1 Tax=Komagataeibacter rhaeticus TaxID=215221 RepID=A0A181CD42_9PROT|nr:EAL domain-containing protein [Komagataeibacter rhaeticus]MBL7240401.1 EAL domain-containing protein [Komagataeibacter rhaeticus]PYD53784.1 c-di-GMP phosphodiesterase [Komagataeibacter rhaeticus]QIP36175.1 EAL domain-containing protein [Komagataeibacter rhaeticus]QOC45933.1 EAL domain-containing protein [Komagataeibacter rhaeticus]SAY49499.1 Oxygen sensor protein DosP [Komagataeibacter rhaeticus]